MVVVENQVWLHVKSRRREDVDALQVGQILTTGNLSTVADYYVTERSIRKVIRQAMKSMDYNAEEKMLYIWKSCSAGWSRESRVANDVTRQSGDRVFSPRSMARSLEISELDFGIIQEAGVN